MSDWNSISSPVRNEGVTSHEVFHEPGPQLCSMDWVHKSGPGPNPLDRPWTRSTEGFYILWIHEGGPWTGPEGWSIDQAHKGVSCIGSTGVVLGSQELVMDLDQCFVYVLGRSMFSLILGIFVYYYLL